MKIAISGSMQFTDRMVKVAGELEKLGHTPMLSVFHKEMIGKSPEDIEKIKLRQKYEEDAITEFWELMKGADAVLILNYDKGGIPNYIGGNTLMEIGFAHVLSMKIFLLNPIPDMSYCKTEIQAVKPMIIDGDLSKIR